MFRRVRLAVSQAIVAQRDDHNIGGQTPRGAECVHDASCHSHEAVLQFKFLQPQQSSNILYQRYHFQFHTFVWHFEKFQLVLWLDV